MSHCARRAVLALAFALLAVSQMLAQIAPGNPGTTPPPQGGVPWEVSLVVYGYLRQDQDSYVDPTATVDHGWLHLEARYNYEDLRTGSLWIGYNFSAGKKWAFKITPMIGGVFGRTTGVAPGCTASLAYKRVTLSISNEYVFDTSSKAGSFYYSWPELSYSPVDWFRVGLAAQHTKAFQSKLEVQRGFLVGFSHKRAEFTAYVFNAGFGDPAVLLALGWNF